MVSGFTRWAWTALLLANGGCGLVDGGADEYVVRVDSLTAPAAVASGEVLLVRFHGVVGSDQCFRLARVERERGPARLEVRFIGERRGGNCQQMPVTREHEERLEPPHHAAVTITVRQPRGDSLVKTIPIL